MKHSVRVALWVVACLLTTISWSQTPEIRLGTPKAWRYDRVYPQLDALMRDVEGTSLKPLLDLDPSAMNSSLVTTIQTYVGVAATYDQGAGITNTANLKQFQAAQPGQLERQPAQAGLRLRPVQLPKSAGICTATTVPLAVATSPAKTVVSTITLRPLISTTLPRSTSSPCSGVGLR